MTRYCIQAVVFTFLSFAAVSNAQVQVPNDFQAGQPARAVEVNENFSVLEDGVNQNSDAIDANTAAIAAIRLPAVTVLDLADPTSCTIAVAGRYVLDRDWLLTPKGNSSPPYGCQIVISEYVTLDFQGFTIDVGDSWPGDVPAVSVTPGVSATIKDGAIWANDSAIDAPQATLRLYSMSVGGQVEFQDGVIEASRIYGKEINAVQFHGNGVVRNSSIHCTVPCIESGPGPAEITNNRITGDLYPTVVATGPGNLIRNNTVTGSILLVTDASASIVAWNTVDGTIDVEATATVLDGNIASGDVNFAGAGNYYGNNRIRGIFNGVAGQTDWGGNVTY